MKELERLEEEGEDCGYLEETEEEGKGEAMETEDWEVDLEEGIQQWMEECEMMEIEEDKREEVGLLDFLETEENEASQEEAKAWR